MKRILVSLIIGALVQATPLQATDGVTDFTLFEETLSQQHNLRRDHRGMTFNAKAPIYSRLKELDEKGGLEKIREDRYSGQPVLIVTIDGKDFVYYPGYKKEGESDKESLFQVETNDEGGIKTHSFTVKLEDGEFKAEPYYNAKGKAYTVKLTFNPKTVTETSDSPLAKRGQEAVDAAKIKVEPETETPTITEPEAVEYSYEVKGRQLQRNGQPSGYQMTGNNLIFAYGNNPPVNGRDAKKGTDEWTVRTADGQKEIGTWKELDIANAANRYVKVDGNYESRYLIPLSGKNGKYRDAEGKEYDSESKKVYTGRRCRFLRGCRNSYAWKTTISPSTEKPKVESTIARAVPKPSVITAKADKAAGPKFEASGETAAMTYSYKGKDHSYEYGVTEDGNNLIYKAADGSWRKSVRDLYYRDAKTGALYKPDGTYQGRIGFTQPEKAGNGSFVTQSGFLHTKDGKLQRYDGTRLELDGKFALVREGLPPTMESSFGKIQEFEFKNGKLEGVDKYGFERQTYEGQSPSDAPSWISKDGKVRIVRSYDEGWKVERKTQVPELGIKQECVFSCGRGWHLADRAKMKYAEKWVADGSLKEKMPEPRVIGTPTHGNDTVLVAAGNSLLMGTSSSEEPWKFTGDRNALIMQGHSQDDFYMNTPASLEKQADSMLHRMRFYDAQGAQKAYQSALGVYSQWYGYMEHGDDVKTPAQFRTALDAAVAEKLKTHYAKGNVVLFEEGVSPSEVIAWQLGTDYASLKPHLQSQAKGTWGDGEGVVGLRRRYNQGPDMSIVTMGSDRMGMPKITETPLYDQSSNISVPQFARWINDPRGNSSRNYVSAHALQFKELAAVVPETQIPSVFDSYIRNIRNPYQTRVNDDGLDVYVDPAGAASFGTDVRSYVLAKIKETDAGLYKKIIGNLSVKK